MKKLILILLAITFVSCSKEQSKDPHSDHNHSEMNNEGHQHEDDILEIDKKVFESMNIEFDSLTKGILAKQYMQQVICGCHQTMKQLLLLWWVRISKI